MDKADIKQVIFTDDNIKQMTEDISDIMVNILISRVYIHEIINNLIGYKCSTIVRNLEVYENIKKEFKLLKI